LPATFTHPQRLTHEVWHSGGAHRQPKASGEPALRQRKFVASVTARLWFQRMASLGRNDAPETGPFVASAFGNGTFVSVGLSKTILTSPDAMTWTLRAKDADFFSHRYNDVIFSNGQFITVGGEIIKTSPDGITWTTRYEEEDFLPGGIAHGNGLYVVAGTQNRGEVRTSPDALTWTAQDYHADDSLNDVAFVTVFSWRSETEARSSPRLMARIGPPARQFQRSPFSVTYVNGYFFALGQFGTALTSADGAAWAAETSSREMT
jgi:hypothetical protein